MFHRCSVFSESLHTYSNITPEGYIHTQILQYMVSDIISKIMSLVTSIAKVFDYIQVVSWSGSLDRDQQPLLPNCKQLCVLFLFLFMVSRIFTYLR